jgi:tRNA(fMet)-specific endonuclease VapC
MTRIMLDTNIVSHLLKAHPNVLRRARAAPMASLCISSITEGELRYGLAKRPEARKLHVAVDELLRRVDVLPWSGGAARRYGTIRADLDHLGKPLASLDLLIAAHALEADAVLATNDRAFRRVEGLRIEDWTEPRRDE